MVVLDEGGVQVVGRSQLPPGRYLRCSEQFFTHGSNLETCPLSCALEEGQNCHLVQVKPRRSCSFQRPPPSREDCSPGQPDQRFAAVLNANINTRGEGNLVSEACSDLREQRLSSEQKETLEEGWCLLSLFIKKKAFSFCFHCHFL